MGYSDDQVAAKKQMMSQPVVIEDQQVDTSAGATSLPYGVFAGIAAAVIAVLAAIVAFVKKRRA